MVPLFEGLLKTVPIEGTLSSDHSVVAVVWDTASWAQWPKIDTLSLKWWSIRTSSSRTLVGRFAPPKNAGAGGVPEVVLFLGKMPAVSSFCALGSKKLDSA